MLRRRILALLAALPILLGLLVPAAAMPCAGGDRGAMSCDVCLVGILPGAPACASMSQAVPAPDPAAALTRSVRNGTPHTHNGERS